PRALLAGRRLALLGLGLGPGPRLRPARHRLAVDRRRRARRGRRQRRRPGAAPEAEVDGLAAVDGQRVRLAHGALAVLAGQRVVLLVPGRDLALDLVGRLAERELIGDRREVHDLGLVGAGRRRREIDDLVPGRAGRRADLLAARAVGVDPVDVEVVVLARERAVEVDAHGIGRVLVGDVEAHDVLAVPRLGVAVRRVGERLLERAAADERARGLVDLP